jgi:hypothetical protein
MHVLPAPELPAAELQLPAARSLPILPTLPETLPVRQEFQTAWMRPAQAAREIGVMTDAARNVAVMLRSPRRSTD